jgi:hypothetical protein
MFVSLCVQLTDMEALNAELEDANTHLEGALQRAAGEKDEALQAAEAAREEVAEQVSLRRDAEAYVTELKNTYATLKVATPFLPSRPLFVDHLFLSFPTLVLS